MSKPLGKLFLLKAEDPTNPGVFSTVANCRSNTLTINNEVIDVTDKDGMPWKQLLVGGVQALDATVAGIFSDAASQVLVQKAARNNTLLNYQMVDGLGNICQCAFQITSFEHMGEYNKEQLYTFKLASTGTPTFTDA